MIYRHLIENHWPCYLNNKSLDNVVVCRSNSYLTNRIFIIKNAWVPQAFFHEDIFKIAYAMKGMVS